MTDTESTTVHSIKLFANGEIRRFSVSGNSFEHLCSEIRSLLSLQDFTVRYEDEEGDLVTIKSDPELECAFSMVGTRPLRLRISEPATQREFRSSTEMGAPIPIKPWKEMKREANRRFREEKKASKLESMLADMKTANSYIARFVKHVTVEDGSGFCPSTSFRKTWRFRNEGTIPWPEKSSLICVGKKADQIGAVTKSVVIEKSVLPGEEIDVSVDMMSPSAGGTYTGFWRLSDPSGRKFGPRVRVHIKVVDSSSSDEEVSNSWGQLLSQLEAMGFTNKGENVKLLVRTHGNMDKVIHKLLRREERKSGIVKTM
jgi:hypothetical protein